MTTRRLLVALMAVVLACGAALGETQVITKTGAVSKTIKGDGTMVVEVHVGDVAGKGPWLGVRIMPVPDALAAHIKTGQAGVMVGNLVKDSPAHKAGLKRYDVIVGIDGKDVKDGPALMKAVRDHKAGDKVALAVVKKGRKKTVPVVLAKPVPADQAKFVYKDDAPAVFRDELRLHPQIILRKGAGNWEKMDGKNLPEEIRKWLRDIPRMKIDPNGQQIQMKMRTVIRKKDSEGRDVRIEQDETGQITVTRTTIDADGKKTEDVSTYKNADELRKMDKDAYELHKSSSARAMTAIGVGGKGITLGIPNIVVGGGTVDGGKLTKEIHEQLLKSIGKMNLPEEVRKQITEQLKRQVRPADKDGDKDKPKAKPKKAKAPKDKTGKPRGEKPAEDKAEVQSPRGPVAPVPSFV